MGLEMEALGHGVGVPPAREDSGGRGPWIAVPGSTEETRSHLLAGLDYRNGYDFQCVQWRVRSGAILREQ